MLLTLGSKHGGAKDMTRFVRHVYFRPISAKGLDPDLSYVISSVNACLSICRRIRKGMSFPEVSVDAMCLFAADQEL